MSDPRKLFSSRAEGPIREPRPTEGRGADSGPRAGTIGSEGRADRRADGRANSAADGRPRGSRGAEGPSAEGLILLHQTTQLALLVEH